MRSLISILIALTVAVSAVSQSAADLQAKVINSKEFLLSPAAEQAGIDGGLTVALTVDKTGAAKDVRILGGPSWPCSSDPKKELEEVRNAVKENVLAARFSPAMKDGKAVSSDLVITFRIGDAYRSVIKQREAEEAVRKGLASPKTIEGGVLNGRALRLAKPDYPSSAGMQRVSGMVSVQVIIDEQGVVSSAGALRGHPLLQSASREAACASTFSPTVLKGQPVKVTGIITYNYNF